MGLFDWFKQTETLETRQDSSYTDTLVQLILSRAQAKSAVSVRATAALEACAGVVGRGFAATEITTRPALADALTPEFMELVGRSLIRQGEAIFLIDTTAGRLQLLPAETHDVDGGPYPDEWEYRLTLGGPSRTFTYPLVPASSVLHFRYSVEPSRPWHGQGPLEVATLAGRLSAEVINVLADESSGPIGRLLGLPIDGEDDTVALLKRDMATARGGLAAIESSADFESSLDTKRYGPMPPQPLVNLAEIASREVYAACGLNAALWATGPGASVREAWRLALVWRSLPPRQEGRAGTARQARR